LGGYHSLSTKRGITLSEIDIKVEPMRKTFKKKHDLKDHEFG
jgi:hypothetical protein